MRPHSSSVLTALLVGTAVLATGCSSTKHAAAPTSSPTLSAAPSPTPLPSADTTVITQSFARTLAAAAILTDSDLPGYTVTTNSKARASDTQELTCLGEKPEYAAQIFGAVFSKAAGTTIASLANVTTTAAAAHQAYSALTSAKAITCLESAAKSSFRAGSYTVTNVTVTPSSVAIGSADESLAYTTSISVSAQGRAETLVVYRLTAIVGPVEDTLLLSSLTSVSAADEANAATLLTRSVARVRAAM